ncbi:hydroxyacylglutathione hydrolase [bacterium]|nr:hydroxyacylglutathione hydrolase [bacterium]
MVTIEPIPLLKDNYAYLVFHGKQTLVIDPSEAAGVLRRVEELGLEVAAVLNTHHHWDHVNGNESIAAKFACPVYGPVGDRDRIAGWTNPLEDGQTLTLAGTRLEVLSIPGHTSNHVALYLPDQRAVFTGDTLFLLGCGRLFEGTPEQMFHSLKRLSALPADTRVYCGHEYTLSNGAFAESLGAAPGLLERLKSEKEKRDRGLPTVPGTIQQEIATNPFLRAPDVKSFADLRRAKDIF